MFEDLGSSTVLEINQRWENLTVSNAYDVLEAKGYANQVLSARIKSLEPGETIAGPAVTLRGPRAPLSDEEFKKKHDFRHRKLNSYMYPGCVLVIDGGGENFSAKLGEFESRGLKEHGARGVIVDGPVRDPDEILNIKDFTVFSDGVTPIASDRKWIYTDYNEIIGVSGSISQQVRIEPGDWIVGGREGVIVVPRKIMMEVLEEAERLEAAEIGMRKAVEDGMPLEEARDIWGRN